MPALPSAQQPWQSISPQLSHAMPELGRPTQHASQRNLPQDVQIPAPTRLWQASHVRSGLSSIACRALACAMRWFWLSSRWVDAGMMAIRDEREYVVHEDFMKAVRKMMEQKKLETKLDYQKP